MKKHQTPLSVKDQIENLKKIGLIINNEEYAEETLNTVSYFRLVKAYSLGLKSHGSYKSNVCFEDLVELYMFNLKLRHLLFAQIERIEVGLRCRVSNYFSVKYGIFGYMDTNNFKNKDAQEHIVEEIENEIMRNKKAPFIRNFRENYETGSIPFYAAAEVMSFGSLSKFYKNMTNADKKDVARMYHLNYTYLESWIESISFVRNICAHYGRLYNARFLKKPKLYKQYVSLGINNRTIFSVILCMKHILNSDAEWRIFVNELSALISSYPNVNISTMGFTKNWTNIIL